MRALMVSWEYPPVVVGGLGRHVDALSAALAAAGHDVVVLTRQPAGAPTALDAVGGLRVLRAAEDPLGLEFPRDLLAWTLAFGHAAVRAALAGAVVPAAGRGPAPARDRSAGPGLGGWVPDVVHAHDWLAAHAAIALADAWGVPLVATVHATESGRHGGRLAGPAQRQVDAVERWSARRADALVTCSAAMRDEVDALFGVRAAAVVPNGVAPRAWAVDPAEVARARARRAPDGVPLLVHLGRLEHEKGVQDLVAALPRIRARHPGARLLVVGTGTQRDALAAAAGAVGGVELAGHLPDAEVAATVAAADAVVLPSHYEPFGIVALEAAAAGAPLVVARTGGLAEVVVDGETGLSFPPHDVAALADAVIRVLDDPPAARRRADRARARLATDFDWDRVAARTAEVYDRARRGQAAYGSSPPPIRTSASSE
ncbi:MAG TPA: glycosyltransferase family 4 protein [Pseudonocardia sp.]